MAREYALKQRERESSLDETQSLSRSIHISVLLGLRTLLPLGDTVKAMT